MSFSSDTKAELCRIFPAEEALQRAELYGMLLFAKRFSPEAIILTTENKETANRLCDLAASCTGSISEITTVFFNKKRSGNLYTVSIPDSDDREKLLDYVGHTGREINLRINTAVIEAPERMSAFLRGAFLSCGSVSCPETEYHLEFVVPFMNLARDFSCIISDVSEIIGDCRINPHVINRKGYFVVYVKDSEQIAELLALMGAASAHLEFIQTKIRKDIRNAANRKTNSEIANMNKTATASAKQVKAIKKIVLTKGLDSLPDDLRQLAELRLENPEMSLRELGNAMTPNVSRSGVNYRMEKLMEIAKE